MREAREHETDDKRMRELIEVRNSADNLVYQTEKTLHELGDKVPGSERKSIESNVSSLREALKGSDTTRIQQLAEELQNTLHALSQQLYAQQSGSSDQQSGTNGSHDHHRDDEGEVLEGEFREA